MVSFEPAPGETVSAACDETASPFTFDAVEPGTTGSFTRVRPTSQSPAVPAAPYGGRWSARVTRGSRTDSVFAEKSVDWTPDTPSARLSTADVYYQLRAYLKAGFLARCPTRAYIWCAGRTTCTEAVRSAAASR